jgi:hypothetical protein
MVFHDQYPFLQTLILALTLFAIVWYTFETRRMQMVVASQLDLSIRQVNLSVLPTFVAHIGELQVENEFEKLVDVLELENTGNGVALNLTVDSIDIEPEHPSDLVYPAPHIVFDPVMSIGKGLRLVLTHRSYVNKNPEENRNPQFDWMHYLHPPRATKDYDLKIRFMDILGNEYVQTIHAGKSGSWPDVVISDTTDQKRELRVGLVAPFSQSPLRHITTRRR